MGETLGLKNINMLTKEQYSGIAEPAANELYAISGSGFGFPSSRYVDLTLGATGASYTAPANGWFVINKNGTDGQLAAFENTTAGGVTWIASLGSGTDCRISCPAKKGDNVRLWYSATGATHFFRFVYAEGEE